MGAVSSTGPALQAYPENLRLPNNSALTEWVARIRAGDVRTLSRAISAVEDRREEALPLLRALFPYSGQARVLGITGSPGAGKSTLVDQLAREYRSEGKTLGTLCEIVYQHCP